MVSDNTNLFQNLKISIQTEETNNHGDSSLNEISYGPGIVQKLCARFLQLSMEHNVIPPIRSPRFKRRKSSAENNFTAISEIRRCSTRTLTTSNLTNKILLNTAKRSVNFGDGQKNELHLVPAMKDFKQYSQQMVDTAMLNDDHLYHATVIPDDTKANRKAKKIESIREKFEKISAISSIFPHKKFNKARFRRGCSLSGINNESLNRKSELVETQGEIRKARHDANTIKVLVKLGPSDNDNLTVTELSTASSVSSLSNFDDFQKQEVKDERRAEKEIIDESGHNRITGPSFQFEALPTVDTASIASNTSDDSSVKMPDRKQNENNGLQEVHRLLKKFNTIREQRAKKCIHEDMIAKTDSRHDGLDQDLMMQLQYQYVSRISIPHSHSSSDSGLHPLYKEKKECLKNISLSKGMNALELMESESQPISQKYHPEETNNEAKIEKEMKKNCTIVALSSKFTTSEECPATVLKMDDNQLESVANGIELKSDVTVMPVDHNVGLLNTIYSNKSNWETHRKSLAVTYFEKKNLEKETDLMERSQERLRSGEFPNTRIAKDEGPVRQSLLSLVMDEDVPELMEAMAEKLEFVFEDLIPTISNAGEGILRNSAKRSRSRPREARLEFHSSSPTVFTYPDEESAVEKAQWDEGKQITFRVYRELFEGKKERSMDEDHKSQSPLRPSQIANNTEFSFVRTVTSMEEPSMAESLLGVTGRISYNNAPMDLARFNKNTISLVAGK